MPYFSNPGGLFNSGVFPDSRPQIDVSGILGALSGGLEGMARAQILRKQVERQNQMQDRELALREQAAQREAENQQFERGMREREYRLKQLTSGVVPEHDEAGTEQVGAMIAPMNPNPMAVAPSALPSPSAGPSPIGRAMGAPGLPPVSVTPSAIPAPQAVQTTVSAPAVTHVPETYDPTKAEAFIRAKTLTELRNEGLMTRAEYTAGEAEHRQQERLDFLRSGREFSKEMWNYKRNNPMPSRSGVPGAMTAGQQHQRDVALALGFLRAHGSDLDVALDDFRNYPEGQRFAQSNGLTEQDLYEAYGKLRDDPTSQIIRVYSSGMVPDVDAAAGVVGQAGAAARRLRGPGAGGTALPNGTSGVTASPGGNAPGAPRNASRSGRSGRPSGRGKADPLAQQRAHYDAAAAALRGQGRSDADIVAVIGARP